MNILYGKNTIWRVIVSLLHNSRVQFTSIADIFVMENTVSFFTSKYYTTSARPAEELIHNDLNVFQLHKTRQGSSGMGWQWHTAIWCALLIVFMNTNTNKHVYNIIMECFHMGKLFTLWEYPM